MRFKKSIQPNELKEEYAPDTYFSINLPKGIVDLHSLSLYYTGNAANYQHTEYITYTDLTFIGSNIDTGNDAILIPSHGLTDGNEVIYTNAGTGTSVDGLTNGKTYYILKKDDDNVSLEDNIGDGEVDLIAERPHTEIHTLTRVRRYPRMIRRFLPRLSSSIIQELVVKVNNNVVEHIDEYNTLYAMLNDIYREYDDIDSTAQDTVQEHNLSKTTGLVVNISRIQAQTRPDAFLNKYLNTNQKTYYIDNFLGFLGEGNSRFFDTRDKDVQITIRLAPAHILYRGFNNIDPNNSVNYHIRAQFPSDYVLTNIHATVDVLDDMPSIPSDYVFKSYKFVKGMYLPDNKKSLTQFQTYKPVDWVLGTFSHPSRFNDTELQLMHCNTDIAKFGSLMKNILTIDDINARTPNSLLYSYEVSKLQKDPYLLNSSAYFIRSGDAIKYCRYRLNNYDITPQLDHIACYNETKKCFQSPYKKVTSILSFESDFFCNAVRLDDSTSDLKDIQWEVEIDSTKSNNKGGYPMLFYCFKDKL